MAKTWAALFVIIALGLGVAVNSCYRKTVSGKSSTCTGTERWAYDNGREGLVLISLLVAGVGYFFIERFENTRPCPRCGERVVIGVMECQRCGFDFKSI